MRMDETLYGISEKVKNFAMIYLVDITKVPDFTKVSRFEIPFFLENSFIVKLTEANLSIIDV